MALLIHLRKRSWQTLTPAFCSNRLYTGEAVTAPEDRQPSARYKTIVAHLRDGEGTRASDRLRKAGRTPATLYSLPQNKSRLISLDTKHVTSLIRQHGRSGMVSQMFNLQLEIPGTPAEHFPVLPRMVHRNAVTEQVENIAFMHCPPERIVKVPVPVKMMGEDMAPGVKKGGYLNLTRRRLNCMGPAGIIPSSIEVDVSNLDFGQRIFVSELSIPSGVYVVDMVEDQPLCKLGGRASRE